MRADERLRVLVTVGMGPWPFDRLVEGIARWSDRHDVFVQTGASTADPGCPHADFISHAELQGRIANADVVITHAGNTVRLVQRMGKVPIAVAREHARAEMGNDHQVAFLRHEETHGRVVAVWNVDELAARVARHHEAEKELLHERPLTARADPEDVADIVDQTVDALLGRSRPRPANTAGPTPGWADSSSRAPSGAANPFARHPLRRYAFAWDELSPLTGPHLDVGVGHGDFAGPFEATSGRPVSAVDASAEYAAETMRRYPRLDVQVCEDGRLGYEAGAFTSVSVLDVLEHVADEHRLLAEVHRVLAPGGTLVVTVPRRHVFTWLDPDNAKFRWPRFHAAVYRARFGAETYERRFVDTSDGFVGDVAVERGEHTNFRTDDLLNLLVMAGFEPTRVTGANLFWRWLQIPALLGGSAGRRVLGPAIRLDGDTFTSPRVAANLFVTARWVA